MSLTHAVGIVVTAIVGLIALVVVWRMWTNDINLSLLLSDNPAASLSRFQFLIFTFIIGFSYLLLVIKKIDGSGFDELPGVNPNALILLGISAGSYVSSKVIQKAADTSLAKTAAAQPAPPAPPPRTGHGAVA